MVSSKSYYNRYSSFVTLETKSFSKINLILNLQLLIDQPIRDDV